MPHYLLTVPEKDEVYIPAINRLAKRSEGNYCTAITENGILYELNFPNQKLMQDFKDALQKRLLQKIE